MLQMPDPPWRGWAAGYCAATSGQSDCAAGDMGSWLLSAAEAVTLKAAAAACVRKCRACSRCKYVSVSAAWNDCSWFHDCVHPELLINHPQTFMTTAVSLLEPREPLPASLPPIPQSWHEDVRRGRVARRHELNSTVFRSRRHLRKSPWYAYLDSVYGVSSLVFPFFLSDLEFFWVRKDLPRHFFDPATPRHAAEVAMGPTIWWPLPRAGKRDEPQQGDIFVLDQGPPHSLFVYMYPGLANPLLDPPTGFGRLAVPFKYEHGFPSHSRVEGVHTGVGERSGGCGFWLYHAPGSGVYLDLGRTQVFAEQWDALVFFTGCDQGAPAENEIEAKTPGNCSAYIKQRTMVVDGRSVLDRPFRREIYLRARARGLDTLQFTHRAEHFYRFEIVDLRVPDGRVTDSCGHRPALSAGWRGTRPCACNGRREVLNCDLRGTAALRAAAVLQGFSTDIAPVHRLPSVGRRGLRSARRGQGRSREERVVVEQRRLSAERYETPTSLARSSVARQWLRAAQRGFCGETDPAVVSDCRTDAFGAWGLRAAEAVSWSSAARACVPRCMECANCRFVTISLQHRDCSWFAKCSAGRLQQYIHGFRSAPVRWDPLPMPPPPPPLSGMRPADADGWPPCKIYVHDPGPHANVHLQHRKAERWGNLDDIFQQAYWLHEALKSYAGRTHDVASADVVFVAHYFQVHLPRKTVYAGGPLGGWDKELAEGPPALLDNGTLLARWTARPADFVIALPNPACRFVPEWLHASRWINMEQPLVCGYRHRFDIVSSPVVSSSAWAPARLVPARRATHFLTYIGRLGKPYIQPPVCQVRLNMWAALRTHPNVTFLATDYETAVVPQLHTPHASCARCDKCKNCLDPAVYALPAGSSIGVRPRIRTRADPRRALREYQGYYLNSTFCLMLRGDHETSRKFTEIILAGCVPVIIADLPSLPFERRLDYRSFSYEFDWRRASAQPLSVVEWLLRVPAHELVAKRAALLRVRERFYYHADTRRQGATRELIYDMCSKPRRRPFGRTREVDLDRLYTKRPKDGV